MKKKILFGIKILISALLLGIIFLTIDMSNIRNAFLSARLDLLLIGVLLMPLNILFQEYKWRYLLKLVNPQTKFSESLGSLLGGFAFGIVTPGRIGEYGRSLLVKDTPQLKLVGLTVIDKFYNLGCTIAFGLPALLTLPFAHTLIRGYLFYSMILMLLVLNSILLYMALDPRPVRSLIYALQMIFPRKGRIAQLLGGLDRFNAPQARMMLLLTLIHYLIFQVQYFLLITGFANIDIFSSIRGAAAILFVKSALPIAIGDLGLDQWISMGFFNEFGVSNAEALNASLLLFTINVLIPALIGTIFVVRIQFGKNQKKNDN